MVFLVALVVDGALAGTVYALAALAFVIVYKASGVINFALGKLVAALAAGLAIAAVSWFFRASRTGVALRAIADDRQTALTVGIDVDRHLVLTWALMGAVGVVAGTLWTVVMGGGFGVALLGLKIFPIVILGGLDSIPGTGVAAILIGVHEWLCVGYLVLLVVGGF